MRRIQVLAIIAFILAMCILLFQCCEGREDTAQAEDLIVVEEPIEVKAPVTIEVEATAYCSCGKCCGVWAINRPLDENGQPIVYTATMTVAKQGRTIAVDPTVIPYGTRLGCGENVYVAEDCGADIKGNRIDVFFEDHTEAKKFGRQTLTLTILED